MYVRDYMGLACAINLYVFPLKKTLCTMLFTLRGGGGGERPFHVIGRKGTNSQPHAYNTLSVHVDRG